MRCTHDLIHGVDDRHGLFSLRVSLARAMYPSAAFIALCFVGQMTYSLASISARSLQEAHRALHALSAHNVLEIRSDTFSSLDDNQRRQLSSATTTNPPASSTSDTSEGKLPADEATQRACVQALSALNGVPSNPTGMSMCYNVDYFDQQSGTFESTLLIYEIGSPAGDWGSMPSSSMSVQIDFPGAAAAPASAVTANNTTAPPKKRSNKENRAETRSQLVRRDVPQLKSDEAFEGQINAAVVAQGNL